MRENEGPMSDPALLLTTRTKLYSVNGLRLSIVTVEGTELLYSGSGESLSVRMYVTIPLGEMTGLMRSWIDVGVMVTTVGGI